MVFNQGVKKIAIVEPHSDDAFLNLGGYILKNPDCQFLIITVAKSSNLENRTFLLKNFGKIDNIYYGYVNLEREDFKKRAGDIQERWEEKNKLKFSELVKRIRKDTKGMKLLLPMGCRDALHNLLSRIDGDGYYREIPYFWAKKEWEGAKGYIYRKFSKKEKIYLGEELARKKWLIFNTIYGDRVGMFRFFRPYYTKIYDEEIYF